MANIVSQISVHQEHELLAKLEAAGLTGQLAQKVIQSRGNTLAKEIVALIRGPQPDFPSYSVLVDYGQTVERLIRDGSYDWVNDDITSRNFPSSERGNAQIDIFLLNFDRNISSEDAIREMDTQGLRPATLKELLALGATHTNLQRENPIVALGSEWRNPDGDRGVPDLIRGGSVRGLSLGWFVGDWFPGWRFAAVRK
ncbi:MAG: hypothetical protein WAV56_00125 [Microgenomates group bacterium]